MLIYVKNIKINLKKKKTFYGQTDRQTDGQLKTIVRNLTKWVCVYNTTLYRFDTH